MEVRKVCGVAQDLDGDMVASPPTLLLSEQPPSAVLLNNFAEQQDSAPVAPLQMLMAQCGPRGDNLGQLCSWQDPSCWSAFAPL